MAKTRSSIMVVMENNAENREKRFELSEKIIRGHMIAVRKNGLKMKNVATSSNSESLKIVTVFFYEKMKQTSSFSK